MSKIHSRRKTAIALIVLSAIIGIILIAAGIHAIRWAAHNKTVESYGEYEFNNGQTEFDLDLFPSLVIDESAERVKIMQIADPQIKFGSWTRDTKTMDLLDRAIKAEQPDICVVTGDLTLSIFTYDAFKYFADFMEARQQYWAFVYGNHDSQFDCSKYTIYKLLSNYEYCLFNRGPCDIYGESNYLVNVFKGEKKAENLAYSLVMLDSGMYPDAENVALTDWVYDWIRQSQMDWYEWAIKGLQAIKADIQTSMFFHIPIKEFANMYYLNRIKNYNSTVTNEQQIRDTLAEQGITTDYIRDVTGVVRESDKKESECVYGDDGYTVGIYYQGNAEGVTDHPDVFQYIKKLNSTKALFCGHDHVNNLKGYYDDVYLAYGLCCGYHTYPFFNSEFFLTKWLGLSDKVVYNADLWTDEQGNKMEKGVTVIGIDLTAESYGSLMAADRPDSFYKSK
ncbi:MAG: metallophosphoesterase [Corallococcus sp.]|nr:metallophosphoesterase [Bacillota bacterium]MCM1533963.1 metallophosphoesterase [Corallococcus sp.]